MKNIKTVRKRLLGGSRGYPRKNAERGTPKKSKMFDQIFVESEPCVLIQNKGFGALPSSRLDSHRNFDLFRLGYVDFRQFPTRFVPIFMFSTRNRPEINKKSTGNRPESTGNQPEIHRRLTGNRSEIHQKLIGNLAFFAERWAKLG